MTGYQNENSSLISDKKFSGGNRQSKNSSPLARVGWILLGLALGIVFTVLAVVLLVNQGVLELYRSDDSEMILTSRQYHKTQTIGFQIYTGGAPAVNNITRAKNEECYGHERYGLFGEGTDAEILCYLGRNDPIEDAKGRLEIMRDAVEKAHEIGEKDDSTLKIFVAPEFFFRGVDGAYLFDAEEEESDCGPVCHILQGLEEMVADERFEHWFFVFGTVIAYDKLPNNEGKDYGHMFYNFAPIYKGYDPAKTSYYGRRFLLPKRYVSNLDFLMPQRHVNQTVALELVDEPLPISDSTVLNPLSVHINRYHSGIWDKYKEELTGLGYAMIEYDWIIIDGITFSIEICLDHFRATALNSYLADLTLGSVTRIPKLDSVQNKLSFVSIPKHQAHISIVSSAGMTVNPEALALCHNGTIYLQDGLYADEARKTWPDNMNGKFMEFEGGSEGIQRQAILTATDVFFQYIVVEEYHKESIYDNLDEYTPLFRDLFSVKNYEPMLVVFDPKEIPRVQAEHLLMS